jgi:hypothetical protein
MELGVCKLDACIDPVGQETELVEKGASAHPGLACAYHVTRGDKCVNPLQTMLRTLENVAG